MTTASSYSGWREHFSSLYLIAALQASAAILDGLSHHLGLMIIFTLTTIFFFVMGRVDLKMKRRRRQRIQDHFAQLQPIAPD